ncbi:MAG: hypothetical protein R3D59_02455 [Paracoccaceae bacterium]|nr:hypothetical protein [Maritimibacter sp.]
MSDFSKYPNLNRREIAALVGGAAALAATPAAASQPHMEEAKSLCEKALWHLQQAPYNGHGHRDKAKEHLEYVIYQIHQGILYGH